MKITLLILALLPLAACAPKVLILQTPVISMTKANTGTTKALKEGKAVDTKWCSGDDPVQENDDGSNLYGMIDQAVWAAHKSTKADFFVNNRFYMQGTCVLMSANVGGGAVGASAGGGGGGKKGGGKKAPPAKSGKKGKKG